MKLKLLILFLLLAMAINSGANTEATVISNELEISGLDNTQAYQLRLQLPNKQLKTLNLESAETISFTADDFSLNKFDDGTYKYELVPILTTKKIRQPDQQQSKETLTKRISGVFTVLKGATINDQDEGELEQENNDSVFRAPPVTGDLTVRNSLCVGTDCIDNETYGFDTVLLKENNLRIKFQDTSNSGSFATNDWEITANESTNGGLNYFGITDVTANNRPFTVEAGAGANALYVDNQGKVGLGTSTPALDLHVLSGNTPSLRLDQDNSQGWGAQVWDVAANETNFFVRDVTNGSQLPLRIRPGSPGNSLDIHPDGIQFLNNTVVIDDDYRFGLNTNNPKNSIHVKEASGNAGIILENLTSGTSWKFTNKSDSFEISKSGTSGSEFRVYETGAIRIGQGGSIPNFDMDANGNVTIQGALTQNSDINMKENIMAVNPSEVLDKVMQLPISVWNYKFDSDEVRHLGPMAQDFFKHFSLGASEDKIATIDTSGVALASIKALGEKLADKETELNAVKAENKKLAERLNAIEAMLEKYK